MISPYLPVKVNTHEDGEPCPSFGQDEAGYSIRPADEWSVLMPDLQHYTIDVRKEGVGPVLIEHRGPYVDIPANSMVLARSVERFHIPSDVIGLAVGKSTQARVGVVAVITPLEPDWRGYLTFEIANHAPYPNRVWAGAGITQLVFFRLSEPASYKGRYQNQPAAIVQAR
jgi:dCTP deaminase